jgi:putative lipoprotein
MSEFMRNGSHDTSSSLSRSSAGNDVGTSGCLENSTLKSPKTFRGALSLLMLAASLSGCANLGADRWTGPDKLRHLAASAALGAGATYAAHEAGASEGEARAAGVGFVLVLGSGKELYDQEVKGSAWSWQDMAWNLLGALLGSAIAGEVD